MKKFPKPDSSADRKIISVIKNQGWCVIDVADAPIPFAYTVGLSLNFSHPEILVSGMDTRTHGYVLNVFGDKVSTGLSIQNGDVDSHSTGGKTMFKAVDWTEVKKLMGVAVWLYQGEKFTALQCYWADKYGFFPFESKCRSTVKKMQLNLRNGANLSGK